MLTHNVNTKEIVDFSLKNFPTDLQIDILQEECAELIKALSKYKRENYPDNMTDFKSDKETRNNLIEEMSHVLISIDVVSSILKISVSEIQDEITKKCKKYCKNYDKKKQEEEDEIKVGDEVVTEAGDKGVVIGISKNDVSLFIPAWNISQVTHKICCKKTGYYFPEISKVLKKLQEGE